MPRPRKLTRSVFSNNLNKIIAARGINVSRLCDATGIKRSTFQDWLTGNNPSDYRAVQKLADELNVSFSFLLTGEDLVNKKESLFFRTELEVLAPNPFENDGKTFSDEGIEELLAGVKAEFIQGMQGALKTGIVPKKVKINSMIEVAGFMSKKGGSHD